MSSLLLLIMLLYLSLAACFCDGRRSLHTSLSHSKDAVKQKYPSSLTKEALSEKVYQATAMSTGKSRSYKNHKIMEDKIRKASRQNCFQRSKTVDVSQHMPPCSVSEENPETVVLACCYHDGLPQRKQIYKVRFRKQERSLLVGTKWNEAPINPSKNITSSSFTDMDYPSAHLAPSVNNR